MLPRKQKDFDETVKKLLCPSKLQVKSGKESQRQQWEQWNLQWSRHVNSHPRPHFSPQRQSQQTCTGGQWEAHTVHLHTSWSSWQRDRAQQISLASRQKLKQLATVFKCKYIISSLNPWYRRMVKNKVKTAKLALRASAQAHLLDFGEKEDKNLH